MLDTDDTLVVVHEDSQVPYSDAAVPESPRSFPLKRQLFKDGEEVDLCTPAPKRMVARPPAKLKHMLAESAEAMRSSRPSSSSGKALSQTSDSLAGSSKSPSIDSIDEGNPGFITRREQLKLQPKAKAKTRAGKPAPVTGESKSKPKTKALHDLKESAEKEGIANPVAEAAAKPKAPPKKRKCATEVTEAMPKAPVEGVHPGAEEACPCTHSPQKPCTPSQRGT